MEERLRGVLHSLGLHKNEALVFLDLLGRNPSAASEIAKRTGLHRTNVYQALRGLAHKSFVVEVVNKKRRLFRAQGLETIKAYLRQHESDLEDLIPAVQKARIQEKELGHGVSIMEGVSASRDAMLSLLNNADRIDVYGIPSNTLDALGEGFLNEFHSSRIKKKVRGRFLFNENVSDRIQKLNGLGLTEARFANNAKGSFAMTTISGNEVGLVVLTNPISAIRIRNEEIAKAYKDFFEMLWQHTE